MLADTAQAAPPAALGFLAAVARQAAADDLRPPLAPIRHQLDALCRATEDPIWPAGLVARPCASAAAVWHWEQLRRLLDAPERLDAAGRARAQFHARWVLRIVEPERPEWRARVSVVIPVYNRARLVREAIDSALAQTHQPVEIVLVDDGSTDAIDEVLRDYAGRLRAARQANGGVSSARNRGVRLATGDYLHFLDSDNVLDPETFERALEAFRCVADAEICYRPAHRTQPMEEERLFMLPPSGGFDCPTTDLAAVASYRHPFLMLGTLLPRWLMLESGGFDERLRRGEDTRLWFQLGLRGTKVIGLRQRRGVSRALPTGLTRGPRPPGSEARVGLLMLFDALGSPRLWVHLPRMLQWFAEGERWQWIASSAETMSDEGRQRLLGRLAWLGREGRVDGLSVRPVVLLCLAMARALARRVDGAGAPAALLRRFRAVAESALRGAPPCGPRDLAHWLPTAAGEAAAEVEAETLVSLFLMTAGCGRAEAGWPGERFWSDLERGGTTADDAREGERPAWLVGRAAPHRAARFHAEALAAALAAGGEATARQARVAYHASWLLSLLAARGTARGPLVSVVIPTFERADVVADAVASCLQQSYPHVEVVVVDDGSREDLEPALRPFASRLRLHRLQVNRGASSARNLGIARASGELIHFLDADDLLAPDAIEKKVEALRCIPDAELVFSGARQCGDLSPFRGEPLGYLEPPTGNDDCPTRDLLRVVTRRYPFLTSTVLVPRWVLLDAGLFDPALRRGQDSELFYRLGLRDTKVVGVAERLTTRRVGPGSLSMTKRSAADRARLAASCLLALCGAPHQWREHAESTAQALLVPDFWHAFASETQAGFDALRATLLARVGGLHETARDAPGAPRDLLAPLLAGLDRLAAERPEAADSPYFGRLRREVAQSLARV
ncbi:MAG: glycosyltransferase [Thermoanaerobaculia bacterium]|nr:glycosyltransferase [Thermoanaerobaculia bacterium]